jgi:hypothetical protein
MIALRLASSTVFSVWRSVGEVGTFMGVFLRCSGGVRRWSARRSTAGMRSGDVRRTGG